METLSCTQLLYLCVINDKGNIPLMDFQASVGLLASGLTEMLDDGCLTRNDKKKLVAGTPWSGEPPYLKPLYERLTAYGKPVSVGNFAIDVLAALNSKQFYAYVAAVGASLAQLGCVEEVAKRTGKGARVKYAPKAEAVKAVVNQIRGDFFAESALPDKTRALAALLDRCGRLKDYFSKIEKPERKARVKEAREHGVYAIAAEMYEHIAAVMIAVS